MDQVPGIDLDALSPDGWEQVAIEAEAQIGRLRAVQAACLQRLDRAQVSGADGHRNLVDWTSARLDISHATAKNLVRVARSLLDLPETGSALVDGRMSFDRCVEIARFATQTTEHRILEDSRGWDLTRLKREAARHRRITRLDEQRTAEQAHFLVLQPDLLETTWSLWGQLTAVEGKTVEQALERRADQMPTLPDGTREPHSQGMATALVSICEDTSDQPGVDTEARTTSGPDVTIFIDGQLAENTNGEAGGEVAGGPRIGPATLELLLCQGKVGILRHLPDGTLLRVGDHRHAIPPAVRRYVYWRDGGICGVDGCNSRYRLQVHHRHPRHLGGTNDPDELELVCWFHHQRVIHQLGWDIDPRSSHGRLRLRPPEPDPGAAPERDPP